MKSSFQAATVACHLLVGAVGILAATASLAGRPLATEDAGVLEKNECEVESFAGRLRESRTTTANLQVGCGIGADTQLAFAAGRQQGESERARYLSFIGKTVVGEFYGNSARSLIAYGVSGVKEPGERLRYQEAAVKGVLTYSHEKWLLHANAGYLQPMLRRITG